MRRVYMLSWVLMVVLVTAGCTSPDSGQPVPTKVDLTRLPTERFLIENAPPAGWEALALDPIDRLLPDHHQSWTYTVTGSFEGTYSDTGEPAAGEFEAVIQVNDIGQAQRVLLSAEGNAFLSNDVLLELEGVRFSNDYYVVDINGRCAHDEASGAAVADLSAGQLIGGVGEAVYTGHRQEIEGHAAWQYTFTPTHARLPAIHRSPDSTVALAADLWAAPDLNAVLRYSVTASVERVTLLWADQAEPKPVSGTLYLQYELSIPDLNVTPNISIPHGC